MNLETTDAYLSFRSFNEDFGRDCSPHNIHVHKYGHFVLVISGSIKVGKKIAGEWQTFGPFDHTQPFYVCPGVEHAIYKQAPKDDCVYVCAFVNRDFDGKISKKYIGNVDATR